MSLAFVLAVVTGIILEHLDCETDADTLLI